MDMEELDMEEFDREEFDRRGIYSRRSSAGGFLGGIFTGLAIGAALMYLSDPDRGRRRRALLRDQSKHGLREIKRGINVTARDVSNRTSGLIASIGGSGSSEYTSPRTLEARVRSALGHAVSHPRAIRVDINGQEVTLLGDILTDELNGALSRVASVQGVQLVNNQLDVHEHSGDVPSLQGGDTRRTRLQRGGWSPAERLLVGAAGGALAGFGMTRSGGLSTALTTIGTGALLRAMINMDLQRLTGVGDQSEAILVQKTIHINAPIDRVYRFWRNVENFSRFMSHVEEVRNLGGGISRWRVNGPAGYSAEWDAVITDEQKNELIAWRSVGEPDVENSGSVRFERETPESTRIDIRMSYRPPAGAIGHFVNALFGTDPQRSMEDDLARLKSLLEHGKTSVNGHEIWLEDISREERER